MIVLERPPLTEDRKEWADWFYKIWLLINQVSSSITLSVTSITDSDSPYTASSTDFLIVCDCTSGAITVNLPASNESLGRMINIKKIDSSANAVTVDGSGAETIDDSATLSISTQYDSYTLMNDQSEWWIV